MKAIRAINLAIPLTGLLASGGLALVGLPGTAAGSLAGTVLAVASWAAVVLLGRGLTSARSRWRTVMAALIGAKLAVMAALVWIAVGPLGFDGIGVAIGLGSLPVGIVAAACTAGPDAWGAAEGVRRDA